MEKCTYDKAAVWISVNALHDHMQTSGSRGLSGPSNMRLICVFLREAQCSSAL